MNQPDEAMPAGRANVLLAIVHLHARNGRVTIREICVATGIRSTSTVAWHLQHLQREELIEWEPGTRGTLRPVLTATAV